MSGATSPANERAVERIQTADPLLVGVERAIDELPEMTPETVLTSGPPLAFNEYDSGQASAIVGGALYEGLASSREEAVEKLQAGDIEVRTCHEFGCVGSIAGITTASMPVFVVEDLATGEVGRCHFYEGESRHRLNYGSYNDAVHDQLTFIDEVIAPVLGSALEHLDGVELRPIIREALTMGDDMHSRNHAATPLLAQELTPAILELERSGALSPEKVDETLEHLRNCHYFFLRPAMAASKATAESAHSIDGSSVVSAMTFNCKEFAIRVSGLGDRWFRAPMPTIEGKYFEGFSEADLEYMGGDSVINATIGLGGLAQAAAFSLIEYQGGSSERMVERNEAMHRITLDEHPHYEIPYFGFRGVPTGIDVRRAVETGITPVMNMGIPGSQGGQIGAGCLEAPIACFEAALEALDG